MLFDDKKQAAPRILIGGLLGLLPYLLLSWLTQPGAFFGGSLGLDFTFCFNAHIPEALGAALGFALWFALGAETAVATLPFADSGRALVLRTCLHFGSMALTLSAWVLLNFRPVELPAFLIPFVLLYLLIWLGRWVGWYVEVMAIREKLGLSPGPSPLKWRETLPYVPFAALLCLALPLALTPFDAADVPVLRAMLYPWLLLPIGGFFSGLSLGKRQGVCPLYPAACALLTLAAVALVYNSTALPFCTVALTAALAGNLLGAALGRKKSSSGEEAAL